MEKFILALDQGTTSSRAIVFDHEGNIRSVAQHEFPQIFPHSGWVEHDPLQIWGSQASVIASAISKIGINGHNIAGIGTTNQRETTIVWDRETGEPVYNAIVWQDRRTSEYCDSLVEEGHAEMIREKTGLIIDAYFSATKIKWILDNVPGARERAEVGKLCFGTVDSWLVSCLTRHTVHVTDVSNAARTMLFNILGEKVTYALEGAIFVGGSVVQWLRDGLHCISSSSDVEVLAASVPDTDGVYFVPAAEKRRSHAV